ncbi:uncharacterized protein LOC126318450 [Schistocerca gregaria]|uniref:uncharacterized protein LOC126318450 n=1 Tax=Schistocerca gregaria TaxID=7010 RepID=UPI00211EA767|nr:uncharacterized protein LOC126318450 [Schistocerca gregaria]XP_049849348.1 uncharacterized protein LOC126318450 [Schistocerca gregaria]
MRAVSRALLGRSRKYCTSTKDSSKCTNTDSLDSIKEKKSLLEAAGSSKYATWHARKQVLMKPSYGMALAAGLTIVLTGCSVLQVWTDPFPNQSGLDSILLMLNSEDLDLIDAGLIGLKNILNTKRFVFSGTAPIAYGNHLIEKNVSSLAEALIHAAQKVTYDNRWKALSWIDKFACQSSAFRQELVRQNCIDWLVELATEEDSTESAFKEWYIASHVLVMISRDPKARERILERASNDSFETPKLIETMESIINRKSPLTLLVMSELYGYFGVRNCIQDVSGNLGPPLLETALQQILPQTIFTSNTLTGATLTSSILFSALGGFWGTIRWRIRLMVTHLRGSQALQWVSTRKIGRPMLIAFLTDMFVQRLLTFASSEKFELDTNKLAKLQELEQRYDVSNMALTNVGLKLNQKLKNLDIEQICLASALTVAENAGFGVFATWLLLTRRYAFFPLFAALTYNHLAKSAETMPTLKKELFDPVNDLVTSSA